MPKKPTYEELEKQIIELEKVKQALRESEEKYRHLFEHLNEAAFLADIETGTILDLNKQAEIMLGRPREEIIGMHQSELHPPEKGNGYRQRFSEHVSMVETNDFDGEVIRKDGSIVPVMIRASTLNLRGKGVILGLFRDITERKKSDEALRESEERLQSILDNSTAVVYLKDTQGRYILINHRYEILFHITKEQVVGKTDYDIFPKEQADAFQEHDEKVTEAGSSIEFEELVPHDDGIHTYISIKFPLIDPEGSIYALCGISTDVTERLKLQDQLHQAQRMEAIGTLAGGVAHDLNNVLSGIVSYPDLLLLKLPEDSTLRKPILTIQESGQKAAAIVQDLLTLARRGVAPTEVVNMNDIISEYLKSPEHQKLRLYHPNIQVETNLETDLLNIFGSKVHLSKAVMNLVSNAAEAMKAGGNILVSTENRYIDRPISSYNDVKEGDYVTLSVSDFGVGISSEDIGRIFEPFYTKKKMGRSGTGLGLPVVRGTVKDHKGYIDIQSSEGVGTTFTLYFPITRKEPDKNQAGLSIKDFMGRGESILVVDDVKSQREIAFTILSELGYSVDTVSSGEEAVEYTQKNEVDLLLLDMIMDPGIDGLDTYKQILKLHPGQKAIIASGFSKTNRVRTAKKLGARQYIKKPYTLEKIGTAIRSVLDK